MMTKTFTAVALVLAATVTGAQAATLINGSFEDGTAVTGAQLSLAPGSTDLTGWTIEATIDVIDSSVALWEAADGNRSVDLNASAAGGISQDITGLIAGRQYDVSFALAGNPRRGQKGDQLEKIVNVSAGDFLGDFTFDITGKSNDNMGWVMKSFSFIAGSTTEKLTFTSTKGTPWGPAIDNVSVTAAAVPLPAAMWLLGGAVAGLAAIRRKA